MNKLWKALFYFLLIFSIIHTIRDVFQIYNIHNLLSDFYVTHHKWCSSVCDYVAFPEEIFAIIGSVIVLKRNKVGVLGWIVIVSFLFWPIALLLN